MPRLTDEQADEAVPLYQGGESLARLATRYGCNRLTIRRALEARGITIRPTNEMTAEEIAEAASLYATGLTTGEVGERLGRAQGCIWSNLNRHYPEVLRTNSEANRDYPTRDDYFSVIDTEEKAYWLGMLGADAAIDNKKNCLSLKLQAGDRHLVERLRDAISPTRPTLDTGSYLKGEYFPQVKVEIPSRQLVTDLAKYGVTARKSLAHVPWNAPEEWQAAYFRGLVDGDGCWRHQSGETSGHYVDLLGTPATVDAFAAFVARRLGNVPFCRFPHHTTDGLFKVVFSRTATVQAIARILYDGATIYLQRKRAVADYILAVPLSNYHRGVAD
jgi:hypothetical protein